MSETPKCEHEVMVREYVSGYRLVYIRTDGETVEVDNDHERYRPNKYGECWKCGKRLPNPALALEPDESSARPVVERQGVDP